MIGFAEYGGRVKFSTQEVDLDCRPEVWKCTHCSSGFVQNIIPEGVSVSLYSDSIAGDRWQAVSFEQQKTPEVLRGLSEIFTGGSRVLDVGCNTGELLDFARLKGCLTSGLEYSSASREVLRSKGHGAYKSFDDLSDSFDVITAFDLVEHLYDIEGFLKRCHDRLVPGGKLIFLTGDIGCQSARQAGSRWWYMQYPEHIVFPSRKYFEQLEAFKLENWTTTYSSVGYDFPVYRILLSRLKSLLVGRKFTGLPSFTPDHALIVLSKVDK